jgi:SAM-dependent methyltransferase
MSATHYYERLYWQGKYERPYERRRAKIIEGIYGRIPFQHQWITLDLGAGTGFYSQKLRQRGGRVVTADLDHGVVKVIRGHGFFPAVCNCDNGRLPFQDRSVEVVNALDILEHLHEPLRLLDEIRRILKPGGYSLISTQNRNSLEGFKGRFLAKLTGTTWKAWDDTHTHIFSYTELIWELSKRFQLVECGGYYYGIHSVRSRPLPPVVWRIYTKLPLVRQLGFTMMMLVRKEER